MRLRQSLLTVVFGSLFWTVLPLGSTAQSFTTLASFDGVDGEKPVASLVQGFDGNLYGTAEAGGVLGLLYGTVFNITLGGTLTRLRGFHDTDGANPEGALTLASDGNFYGTTKTGGAHNFGTVFRITPSSKQQSLYSFCSQPNCVDGVYPVGGLVQGTDGNF